ncbi:hypothetical protein FRB99_000297 [Tulasnella sp. 403]|nr:hypothetical protein FRB99_000297 [Tulasnella sp. 403]
MQDLELTLADALVPLESFRLKRSRFTFPKNSEIGIGGFASVHCAMMDRSLITGRGTTVAVKKLHCARNRKTFLRIAIGLVRELRVLVFLDHPNIVPVVGFCLDVKAKEAWLVTEYAPNGNALEFLNARHPDYQERIEMLKDTIKGLQYLHSHSPPISHGDIKLANVLISTTGRAMLCDFGLSKTEEEGRSGLTTSDFQHAGTLRYQSPELLEDNTLRSLESDIWAWGCLALELMTGQAPYQDVRNEAAIVNRIVNGIPPAAIEEIDTHPSLRELLNQCWEPSPSDRPSATVCLNVLTADDKRAFLQQSLWASPTVVDTLEKDLTGYFQSRLLVPLEYRRMRRSIFTFVGTEPIGGNVWRANMSKGWLSGETVDVTVKRLRITAEKANCSVVRELLVWRRLWHDNVVDFLGFYLSDQLNEAWFISPYVPNGDVCTYISNNQPDLKKRLALVEDVARGLKYLHNRDPPVCHGDVKSANILVDADGHAMLNDFGLARSMEGAPSNLTTSTFDQCKSIAYQSPEIAIGKSRRSPQSDVWAWGCVACEVLTDAAPFDHVSNPSDLVRRISEGELPARTENQSSVPYVMRDVVSLCWQLDAAKRLTMEECCAIMSTWRENARYEIQPDVPLSPALDSEHTIMGKGARSEAPTYTVRKVLLPNEPKARIQFINTVLKDLWKAYRPFVCGLAGFRLDGVKDGLLLAWEHTSNGNLADYIREKPLDIYQRKHLRNIFIDNNGRAVLSSFGVHMTANTPITERTPAYIAAYASPEVVRSGVYTRTGDMWAWACIAAEVLTGTPPYHGTGDSRGLLAQILDETLPYTAEVVDHDADIRWLTIFECWINAPESRPDAERCATEIRGSLYQRGSLKTVNPGVVLVGRLSPDGKLLALLSLSHSIDIYSIGSGQVVKSFEGNPRKQLLVGRDLWFSRDSQVLAECVGTTISLWDLSSEMIVKTLGKPRDKGYIIRVDFPVDGMLIASVRHGEDISTRYDTKFTIQLWDLHELNNNREFQVPRHTAYAVTVSPDSRFIVTSGDEINIWDTSSGAMITSWKPPACTEFVEFPSSGQGLIGLGEDGVIRLWNLPDASDQVGEAKPTQTKEFAPYAVIPCSDKPSGQWSFSVSPNGKWAVSLAENGELWARDLGSGAALLLHGMSLKGRCVQHAEKGSFKWLAQGLEGCPIEDTHPWKISVSDQGDVVVAFVTVTEFITWAYNISRELPS